MDVLSDNRLRLLWTPETLANSFQLVALAPRVVSVLYTTHLGLSRVHGSLSSLTL